MDLLETDLVFISKDNTINKVGNSKAIRVKVGAKIAKSKSESKNLVKLFLTKS